MPAPSRTVTNWSAATFGMVSVVPLVQRIAKAASYTIPRSIFGTFLEPIGNSTHNGLWAEILQNPSFEDHLWDVKHTCAMKSGEACVSCAEFVVTTK